MLNLEHHYNILNLQFGTLLKIKKRSHAPFSINLRRTLRPKSGQLMTFNIDVDMKNALVGSIEKLNHFDKASVGLVILRLTLKGMGVFFKRNCQKISFFSALCKLN